MKGHGRQILIALDQTLNALLGGWADETLSSRAYRWSRDGVRHWPRMTIDRLFFWQTEHCKTAYQSEYQRVHLPVEFRSTHRGSTSLDSDAIE